MVAVLDLDLGERDPTPAFNEVDDGVSESFWVVPETSESRVAEIAEPPPDAVVLVAVVQVRVPPGTPPDVELDFHTADRAATFLRGEKGVEMFPLKFFCIEFIAPECGVLAASPDPGFT